MHSITGQQIIRPGNDQDRRPIRAADDADGSVLRTAAQHKGRQDTQQQQHSLHGKLPSRAISASFFTVHTRYAAQLLRCLIITRSRAESKVRLLLPGRPAVKPLPAAAKEPASALYKRSSLCYNDAIRIRSLSIIIERRRHYAAPQSPSEQ